MFDIRKYELEFDELLKKGPVTVKIPGATCVYTRYPTHILAEFIHSRGKYQQKFTLSEAYADWEYMNEREEVSNDWLKPAGFN